MARYAKKKQLRGKDLTGAWANCAEWKLGIKGNKKTIPENRDGFFNKILQDQREG
jgi:hypothetical protein